MPEIIKYKNVHIIKPNYRTAPNNITSKTNITSYSVIFNYIKYHNFEIDYLLSFDVDEYFYLERFNNISELISNYLPFDLLLLNLLFMGNDNLFNSDNKNCINTYQRSEDKLRPWGKSIAKYTSILKKQTNPHLFHLLNNNKNKIIKNINNQSIRNKMSIDKTNDINSLIVISNNELKS